MCCVLLCLVIDGSFHAQVGKMGTHLHVLYKLIHTNYQFYLTIKCFIVPVIHCRCFFLDVFIDCAVKMYQKKKNSVSCFDEYIFCIVLSSEILLCAEGIHNVKSERYS